jgi:photosystem II stability/assembly factor-like uncharacterized protein
MYRKYLVLSAVLIAGLLISSLDLQAQDVFDEDLIKDFTYRNIGPTRQGGRIVDFAVHPTNPYTFYAASASGGLWKTMNNGTTFAPVFDDQSVISIGDVAVAPSDPETVWVGTGEANNSRSAYWGDGIYKSTDGGKTWAHMGLKESHHIGRILIHPQNPDIVYVAALGHLFSFNEERGLYKTTDGGKTWDKVLYISERVGVVDADLDPTTPDTLYAASYDKERLPWTFEESGPGSAVYRSRDAGRTWQKLEGGLPSGKIGRIGLDVFQRDPKIVYAAIENANPRPETKTAAKKSATARSRQPRTMGGEIYRSEDGGDTWTKMNSDQENVGGSPGYYYGQIRVDPNDEQTIYVLSVNLFRSQDGGRSWGKGTERNAAPMTHSDHHALWIDPDNSEHMLLGNDGGLYITHDRGATWDHYQNLPLAQYYAIGVDNANPYNVYGGLQDNGSWKGPSSGPSGSVTARDWIVTGGGDGMYNQVDPHDNRWLYNGSQFGSIQRLDQKTWESKSIRPREEKGQPPLRFNWCAPIHLSPHNSSIVYFAGNVLFRSMDRGDNWQAISPDLTLNDPGKTAGRGNIQYCTIVTVSESPVTPGIIWVGTDDGKIHITENGGAAWTELTGDLVAAGAPRDYWVSRVFASPHAADTAFVSKTGYRRDDFRAFLFKTTDKGKTWADISGNLPEEPINVVVQDRINPGLLFVGTDMGVYASISDGKTWVSLRGNMPTTAVHDLLVHARENDLVVGTHGRGIFIADVSPLQELDDKVLAESVHLFAVKPKVRRTTTASMFDAFSGHRFFSAPNEPEGLVIHYYLKDEAVEKPKITISDSSGKSLRSLTGVTARGIHSVVWNMRAPRSRGPQAQAEVQTGPSLGFTEYLVTLELGDTKLTQKAVVRDTR